MSVLAGWLYSFGRLAMGYYYLFLVTNFRFFKSQFLKIVNFRYESKCCGQWFRIAYISKVATEIISGIFCNKYLCLQQCFCVQQSLFYLVKAMHKLIFYKTFIWMHWGTCGKPIIISLKLYLKICFEFCLLEKQSKTVATNGKLFTFKVFYVLGHFS